MQLEQLRWSNDRGWQPHAPGQGKLGGRGDWLLLFGGRGPLGDRARLAELQAAYPEASLLGCSTAGEICATEIADESLVATVIAFDSAASVRPVQTELTQAEDSYAAGQRLAAALDPEGLVHVFLLSEGLRVNGSELVRGVIEALPAGVAVTGGLAGDGSLFAETLVVGKEGVVRSGTVAAVGLYGDRLRVGYGSWGGWDAFGPERLVTKSAGNVLYSLDGRSALGLYKEYLGEYAAGLPATGLLFPLSLRLAEAPQESGDGLTRTILAIDEENQGLVFAGDVPEGATVRLMKANFDRLVVGAETAALAATLTHPDLDAPDLAICISCVGRKLVLKQRTEEELEVVQEVVGDRTILSGFYSYGEIAPFRAGAPCRLHNQTMTITTFHEV